MKKILRKVKNKLTGRHKGPVQDERTTSMMKILDEGLGHQRSVIERKPVDATGQPVPWFTYPAIEYLKQLNLSSASILEWGIGNSTRFFAARCREIFSVEHDREWFDLIAGQLPANAFPAFATAAEYEHLPLKKDKQFDVIIVDGIKRAECIQAAFQCIKNDGLLIFDNSDRNPELCKLIRDKDFIQVDFHGFGPINTYTWTTSLFFSRNFNIKPVSFQPLIPIGGGF